MTSKPHSVHPHAGGENSPRFRSGCREVRFTPTRVGKTYTYPPRCNHLAVHPHAGGENQDRHTRTQPLPRFTPTRVGKTFSRYIYETDDCGSPPRGWGKRVVVVPKDVVNRFTPTRVGKTTTAGTTASTPSVHPHAGGENVGIRMARDSIHSVHPHAGGENDAELVHVVGLLGSPPRGWGKLSLNHSARVPTPVHPHAGGENVTICRYPHRLAVHPHAGGENSAPALSALALPRFTPTRVGKTPHCGGLLSLHSGSPPRGWGKPCKRKRNRKISRAHLHTPGECLGSTVV